MKDVFDSTKIDLNVIWKQNELLKDQLLEATLKNEVECCVLLSHECVDNIMQDEIGKVQRDSISIQEGMQKRLSATSSVRRPLDRNSSFKNSVISNTKNSSEKVEVSDRANQKQDVASKNVALNTIVTNDEIKNALIAKNVLCVSCAKNVLVPCHDNCLAKKIEFHNHEDSSLTSSIDIEAHEAPPIVTTSEEQTSPISLTEADEFYQEDLAKLDGNTLLTSYDVPDFSKAESSTNLDPTNMHEFYQV
ncbi:hypothetical protein Tco_1318745 [Tanacetum coccineum]